VRTLLSDQLKRRICAQARGQGALGARVGLDQTRLSSFLHDRLAIGPLSRARFVRLGAILGLTENQCFREVSR
jgi:hypothetical protein